MFSEIANFGRYMRSRKENLQTFEARVDCSTAVFLMCFQQDQDMGSLSKMQIFRLHPRWTESETQTHVGPAVCALIGLPDGLYGY